MSVVVEAIESVVDFVDEKIIQPIADDPLGFIATTAGYMIAGPLGAGIGNTAAGLAQGEDFDEAVKGGVIAGATAFVGDKIAQGLSSTPVDDAAVSAAASTSDDITRAAASGGDDILNSPQVNFGTGNTSPGTSGFDTSQAVKGVASGVDDSLAAASSTTPSSTVSLSSSAPITGGGSVAFRPVDYVDDITRGYSDDALRAADDYFTGGDYATNASRALGGDDPWTVSGTGLNKDVAARSFGDAADDAITAGADKPYSITNAAKNEIGRYWDKAKGALGDVVDFASDYPIATTAGVVLLADALNKDEPDDDQDTDLDERKDEAENRFNARLQNLRVDREPTFLDDESAYLSYGETGGEHQFFSPTVYTPVAYADGGQVAQPPSRINPAFAFYKYGNVPDTVRRYGDGGYASGGSQGDGRSDHIEALLSPGEFVVDAETVSMLGNGSSEAGARRLEEMRKAIRKQKGGALSKGKFSPDAKSPLAYLRKGR
jgi:hypothetical protein